MLFRLSGVHVIGVGGYGTGGIGGGAKPSFSPRRREFRTKRALTVAALIVGESRKAQMIKKSTRNHTSPSSSKAPKHIHDWRVPDNQIRVPRNASFQLAPRCGRFGRQHVGPNSACHRRQAEAGHRRWPQGLPCRHQEQVLKMSRLANPGLLTQLISDVALQSVEGKVDEGETRARHDREKWSNDANDRHNSKLMKENYGATIQFFRFTLPTIFYNVHLQSETLAIKPEPSAPL